MWYAGSKTRHRRLLVPLIQKFIDTKYCNYLEPFLGGCNVLPYVQVPKHGNKYGSDINHYLIQLYYQMLRYGDRHFPEEFTVEKFQWAYEQYHKQSISKQTPTAVSDLDWYIGLMLACGSFGCMFGQKMRKGVAKCNMALKSAVVTAEALYGSERTEFHVMGYDEWKGLKNYVIYCDPPYSRNGESIYGVKFDFERFYSWCAGMAKDNIVLVSEYQMPEDRFIKVDGWAINNSLTNLNRSNMLDNVFMVKGGVGL